jgi:hypothetical protein
MYSTLVDYCEYFEKKPNGLHLVLITEFNRANISTATIYRKGNTVLAQSLEYCTVQCMMYICLLIRCGFQIRNKNFMQLHIMRNVSTVNTGRPI